MDRREFLYSSMTSILGAYVLSGCRSLPPQKDKDLHLLVGLQGDFKTTQVRMMNMKDGTWFDYSVPMSLPHSTLVNPLHPDHIYFFEYLGSAIRYDLRTNEMIHIKANADSDECFSGHSTDSHDHKIIWCAEEFRKKKEIRIRARWADSLELVPGEQYNFIGGHQVSRLPGTKTLVSSEEGAITFFDLEQLKIVKRNPVDFTILHVIPVSNHEVMAVPTVRSPMVEKASSTNLQESLMSGELMLNVQLPLIYTSLEGEVKRLVDEEKAHLFRMNYAIEYMKPGYFLSSHNRSNTVILWENFKIKHIYDVMLPLNVLYNPYRESFFVTTMGQIKEFSTVDYREIRTLDMPRPVAMTSAVRV